MHWWERVSEKLKRRISGLRANFLNLPICLLPPAFSCPAQSYFSSNRHQNTSCVYFGEDSAHKNNISNDLGHGSAGRRSNSSLTTCVIWWNLFYGGIRANLYNRHPVSELPRATLLRSARAIMGHKAITPTVSAIIPGSQNNAKPNHESFYWQNHQTWTKLLTFLQLWTLNFIPFLSLRVENHNQYQNTGLSSLRRWHYHMYHKTSV